MVQGSSRDSFLANLEVLNRQVATDQERMNSGLRVNRASDDPSAVADILRLNTQIAASDRMQQDLGRVKSEVDSAENAMQSAISLLEKAISDASEGATTTNASRRPILAKEIQSILEQMVSLSRTTSDGRYVFSGDNDQTALYQMDGATVKQAATATNTRLVSGPGGATLSVSKTASELFDARDANGDATSENVFNAIQKLQTALENNDESGIDAASDLLHSALTGLNNNLAFYGTAQNRVQAATDLAAKYEAQWKVEQSDRRDADMASTIVDSQTAQLHLQAAMQMEGQRPKTSLFDYLK